MRCIVPKWLAVAFGGVLWAVLLPRPTGVIAQDAPAITPLEAEHPSLLFAAGDLPSLRAKARGDGVAGDAFEQMKRRADGYLAVDTTKYVFHGTVAGRALTTQVLNLAMTGYATGDDAYLDKATAVLCAAAEQSDADDLGKLNGALAIADAVHAYAVGYDWLYPAMTDSRRELIREELRSYGRWLFEHSATDFWGEDETRRMAHNWNGVTHGGLGLAALALGEQQPWLDRATERVRAYLEHSKDETGASYEGVSYMGYGLQNVVPFAVALQRQGGPDLLTEYPATRLIPEYVLW